MSSPMYEMPVHCPIGVDASGNGPVAPDEKGYVETICWCAVGKNCRFIEPFDERLVPWRPEDARILQQRVMEVNPE